MFDYEDEDPNGLEESGSEKFIDPNDLIMIEDNHNWKPTENFILGYANQLGFDVENDPPEMLSIAEKYLSKSIPDMYQRAFAKDNYQLVYINRITNEIKLKSDIEEEAIKEYQEVKEKYLKEMKEKEKKANIVTVLPRKKIAPIGGKKVLEDPIRKREKEFLKKIEMKIQEKEKEKENEDEEIKQLNEKIKRDENKDHLLRDLDISNDDANKFNDEIKMEENDENENDDINFNNKVKYDKNNEFNSKEKKFPNKNKIKNNNINNNNNVNKQNNNLVLNLNDSNDLINNKNNDEFDVNLSDYNSSISVIKDQYKGGKNESDNSYDAHKGIKKEEDDEEKYNKISKTKIRNKIKYDKTPSPQPGDQKKEDKISKIERKNKKRKSIEKNYKYDKRKVEEISNNKDISSINNEDNSNMEKKNNDGFDENEDDEEELKNIYLNKIKKELKESKKKYMKNYTQKKNVFIREYNENILIEKKNNIKNYQNELKDDLSQYEKELENNMNIEIEKYKNNLIEEYEESLNNGDNDDIKDNNWKNMEMKKKKLVMEIKEQKEKNEDKNETEGKKVNNNLNNKKKHYEEMNKIKMSRLDLQNKNKVSDLLKQYEIDFNNYVKQYKEKNKYLNDNPIINNSFNTKNKNDDISLNEILEKYSKDSEYKLEEKKLLIKEEYENKLKKELEEYKKINNPENKTDSEKLSEEKKILENEYYKEMNKIKSNNKEKKEIDEIKINLINKTSENFEKIKNNQKKEITSFFQEIIQKIKNEKENKDNKENEVDDYLNDIITDKKVIMSKFNTLVDMAQSEYNENRTLIQYFIDIVRSIKLILSDDKDTNNNDEKKIDQIINNLNPIINEYKIKFEKEKKSKLFPFLDKAFQKIMNLLFNDENTNNIIDNSIYGQFMLNNNNSINMTYLNNNINNTILNESNAINNNINNINSINELNSNILRSNNLKLNQTFNTQTQPQSQMKSHNKYINISSSFSPKNSNKPQNILNKTFSNAGRQNNIKYNFNPIDEEESKDNENISLNNNINDSLPQLSNNILDKFSPDCIKKYNIIINFLMEESNNIKEELKSCDRQKNSKNKFDILRETGQFSQYNNIFNRISLEENNKLNLYIRSINAKEKGFEMIKKNCEENFGFIGKYSDRSSIVISKLNEIINRIEDYNIKFMNKNLYEYNNIENDMNNTMNIGNKNNKILNIMNDNSFINNTFHSQNFYNNYMRNLSNI